MGVQTVVLELDVAPSPGLLTCDYVLHLYCTHIPMLMSLLIATLAVAHDSLASMISPGRCDLPLVHRSSSLDISGSGLPLWYYSEMGRSKLSFVLSLSDPFLSFVGVEGWKCGSVRAPLAVDSWKFMTCEDRACRKCSQKSNEIDNN